jgi:hypothetical protein
MHLKTSVLKMTLNGSDNHGYKLYERINEKQEDHRVIPQPGKTLGRKVIIIVM